MDLVVWLTQTWFSLFLTDVESIERSGECEEVTNQVPPAVREAYLLSRQGPALCKQMAAELGYSQVVSVR